MIKRIKTRADFLAMQDGPQANHGAIIVRQLKRDGEDIRAGFTATKKLGNAVVRNRAKRRMRALAAALLPDLGRSGYDYVFIARSSLVERDWDLLVEDTRKALLQLQKVN